MLKMKITVLFSLLAVGVMVSAHAEEDNFYKFDAGFYELIYPQSSPSVFDPNAEVRKQFILINVENSYETQLKGILENMNATNIFVSESLDFVSADVPVNRIIELIDYKFIYKLGDEPELEPQGLSMTQAKDVVGASNVGSGSYSYTGDGVTVGVIDTLVDFSHPDLQGKKAGQYSCLGSSCIIPLSISSPNDHGTALAGIIAGDSSSNSRDGVARDSQIFNTRLSTLGETSSDKSRLSRTLDFMVVNDIDIAMTSLGHGTHSGCNDYSALSIVIDKAVDYGISFSTAVGNENNNGFVV